MNAHDPRFRKVLWERDALARFLGELRALGQRDERAAGTFQAAHRLVRVQRDDQAVAARARVGQVARVADVDEVEAAVREHHAAHGSRSA